MVFLRFVIANSSFADIRLKTRTDAIREPKSTHEQDGTRAADSPTTRTMPWSTF